MFAQSSTGECIPTLVRTSRILDFLAIGRHADPRVPLLIRGEPGVGKDVLARLIHGDSPRRDHGFVKVNCAAQPADHLEADLYGHEKGASPSATRRRLGSFEYANDGTLYLDEIGAVPHALVPKLLRTLRTGEVSRAGGRETMRTDVRVIASTARSAETESDDLWQQLYSVGVVEICIPPLRQRTDEIAVFASFFLDQLNRRYRRDVQLCPDVLAAFQRHAWPGNIRELEEAVHRLVVGGAGSRSLVDALIGARWAG